MIDTEILADVFAPIMGWFIWVLLAYFVAIVTDYLTGTVAAYINGEWKSSKSRKGLLKKLLMLAVLVIPLIMDALMGIFTKKRIPEWTFRGLFLPLTTAWYIFTELGSIVENIGKLGLPVPAFLKKAIASFKIKSEKAGDELVPEDDDPESEPDAEPDAAPDAAPELLTKRLNINDGAIDKQDPSEFLTFTVCEAADNGEPGEPVKRTYAAPIIEHTEPPDEENWD